MDSSSQLNLCHDILLPSEECPGNGYASPNQRRKAIASAGKANLIGNKRKAFSRAASWSTSLANTINRPSNNNATGHQGGHKVLARGPGSNTLVRQMAVTSATGGHPALPPPRQLGARRRAPLLGEFQRMRSFHVMAFRNKLSGSSTSLPKQSNSEPEAMSIDTTRGTLSRSTSRQSSCQETSLALSTSSAAAIHSRIMRMTSNTSAISQISGFSDDFQEDEGEEDGLILSRDATDQEKREYGQIDFNVYTEYFKAGGLHFSALFLLLSIGLQCVKVYMDFLLRDWSLDKKGHQSMSYFHTYSSLSLCVLVLSCSANLIGQLIGARARRVLHSKMLNNLLRCPLDVFEAYPIGRIISRFSYDMFVVDQKLPSSVQRLVLVSLICLSALTVNAIQSPLFIIFALPMVFVYWWLQHFYRCSSRELQRIDSITRAPVLSHFSDTLGGLVTIRAFREQNRFINQLCEKIDANTTAFLILQSGCRWLGVSLDFTGAFMVFISVILNLFVCYQSPDRISSASVGLSMNYSLLVPIYLAWVVKFLADIENYMNAVERILEYTHLDSEEGQLKLEENDSKVITEGVIKFESVGIAHSYDLRAVIQGLNLEIAVKQKVGICGRSGSGKSTLCLALARIAKTLSGKISINGLDIANVPLSNLRRFVWTVPQDVTLFSGTVRSNLDPDNQFQDDQIWQSLEQLGITPVSLNLANGLDTEVLENGENFSHGQKQELSLARTLLVNPPIVILDEATSALDPAREIQLHRSLLKAFANSTLISVAHRLSNIIHYDRVLVMGDGRILEDGKPKELLKKPMGFFSALWRAAGEKPL